MVASADISLQVCLESVAKVINWEEQKNVERLALKFIIDCVLLTHYMLETL